jgi:hypothetical protein
MNKSESIKELAAALAKAQAAMPAAKFDATNPFLKNKYASLGAIIEAARAPLAANGLSVAQLPVNMGEAIGVTTILMHASGEYIESTLTLPVGDEKGKSTAQVAGSVITYLRRYALASVLGIYADEDTDGSAPAKKVDKPAPATIDYPPELAVVTNSQGEPYVTLDSEKLGFMLGSITKSLNKPDTTEDEKATLAMKAQVIRDILKLRN